MKEKLRPYIVPLLIIAAQFALGLFFILTNRLPDPNVVTEWPTGLSTKTYPLWIAAIQTPVVCLLVLLALAAEIHSPWPKKWRAEAWKRRGGMGNGTNILFLIFLALHYIALLNVSSGWSMNQRTLQTIGGVLVGLFTIILGNYQTKLNSLGLWSFTPWRTNDLGARQKCQRLAGRIAMSGGGIMLLANALLSNASPLLMTGTVPLYLNVPVTVAIYFLMQAIIAAATWKLAKGTGEATTMSGLLG